MAMVENDAEALGHYGLTMTLLVVYDAHELTTTVVSLPWSSSDH